MHLVVIGEVVKFPFGVSILDVELLAGANRLVPTKLGPCEIHSPLGAGGMGEVYRAIRALVRVHYSYPQQTKRATEKLGALFSMNF